LKSTSIDNLTTLKDSTFFLALFPFSFSLMKKKQKIKAVIVRAKNEFRYVQQNKLTPPAGSVQTVFCCGYRRHSTTFIFLTPHNEGRRVGMLTNISYFSTKGNIAGHID